MDNELKDVLNKGNGIALICYIIECPNCHNNILIDGGYHCGFDAVLEGYVSTDCYKCLTTINVDTSNHAIVKGMKFMTISEFTEYQLKNSKQK
jgi:hypothetical protein